MAPVNSTEPAGPYETIIMQKNTAIAVILLLVFLFWLGLMLAGMRVINRWARRMYDLKWPSHKFLEEQVPDLESQGGCEGSTRG